MIAIYISTRVVFLIGRLAIKIPIDKRGWLQGLNERHLWNQYKTKNCFAPLICAIGGIVIQKRIAHFDGDVSHHAIEYKKSIPELNIQNCDLHNPKNWGMHNGKIVLLDYGINERISKMY